MMRPLPSLLVSSAVMGAFLWLTLETFLEGQRIPTASMEPTFRGDPVAGDVAIWSRMGSTKVPERFSVVVARHPNRRDLRVLKRVVGLPGEQVRLFAGDAWLFAAGHRGTLADAHASGRAMILRKPRDLQASLFAHHRAREGWHWRFDPPQLRGLLAGARSARVVDEALQIDAVAPLVLRLPGTFAAGGPGAPGRVPSNRHRVEATADLSVRMPLRVVRAGGRLRIAIFDAWRNRTVTAELRFEDDRPVGLLRSGDQVLGRVPVPVDETGAAHVLGFESADGRLALRWNDEDLLVRDMAPLSLPSPKGQTTIDLELEDIEVAIGTVTVAPDLHWSGRERLRFDVPGDAVVLLGDHPQRSEDARSWTRVRVRRLADDRLFTGDATAPGEDGAARPGANPWQDRKGTWHFRDLAGTIHELGALDAFRLVDRTPTPYVPLTDVVGRAWLRVDRHGAPSPVLP